MKSKNKSLCFAKHCFPHPQDGNTKESAWTLSMKITDPHWEPCAGPPALAAPPTRVALVKGWMVPSAGGLHAHRNNRCVKLLPFSRRKRTWLKCYCANRENVEHHERDERELYLPKILNNWSLHFIFFTSDLVGHSTFSKTECQIFYFLPEVELKNRNISRTRRGCSLCS